jgi:hypothetical protein
LREEVIMPRRERDWELRRRRKRREERRKLRAKGPLAQAGAGLKENAKKTSEKAPATEAPKEEMKEPIPEG